ncbi:MAG: hypothetical protein ABJR05_16290 [Balneola sp.]
MSKREQLIERIPQRAETQMIPEYVADNKGLVTVDSTRGKIQPIQATEGVQTVGELEVIDHIKKQYPIVDVRVPDTKFAKSIPASMNIPLDELSDHMDKLDRSLLFFSATAPNVLSHKKPSIICWIRGTPPISYGTTAAACTTG